MRPNVRNDTKERAVEAAERLLIRAGLASMSMDAIAKEVGVRKPSLYYFFPNGKDEIFLAVLERRTVSDGQALEAIIERDDDTCVRLTEVGAYFSKLADRRPYKVLRDALAGLPTPIREQGDHLIRSRVFDPLCRIMDDGMRRGQLRLGDPGTAAGLFVTMLSAMADLEPAHAAETAPALARYIVDIFIRGAGIRGSGRRSPRGVMQDQA